MVLDGSWTIEGGKKEDTNKIIETTTFVTLATIAFKLFIAWPYFDVGCGKYTDPLRRWTLEAHLPPLLDTYVCHAAVARCIHGLLGLEGLSRIDKKAGRRLLHCTIVLMRSMHVGIALMMDNAVLLSLVACDVWRISLPGEVGNNSPRLVILLLVFALSFPLAGMATAESVPAEQKGTAAALPKGMVSSPSSRCMGC
jgi:hypothetical protein